MSVRGREGGCRASVFSTSGRWGPAEEWALCPSGVEGLGGELCSNFPYCSKQAVFLGWGWGINRRSSVLYGDPLLKHPSHRRESSVGQGSGRPCLSVCLDGYIPPQAKGSSGERKPWQSPPHPFLVCGGAWNCSDASRAPLPVGSWSGWRCSELSLNGSSPAALSLLGSKTSRLWEKRSL